MKYLLIFIVLICIISVFYIWGNKYIFKEYCGDGVYGYQKYIDGNIEYYKDDKLIIRCPSAGVFSDMSQECQDTSNKCRRYMNK